MPLADCGRNLKIPSNITLLTSLLLITLLHYSFWVTCMAGDGDEVMILEESQML